MRAAVLIPAALALLLLAGCGTEKATYNDALDADRGAREKMISALGQMRDAALIAEQGGDVISERDREVIESKKAEAVDAYKTALEDWEKAEGIYLELITEQPEEAVFVNNLGNMIYNKIYCGLEGDLSRAEGLLRTALDMVDREIFRRNLELIEALKSDVETIKLLEENRAIVAELRTLLEAEGNEEQQ